MPSGIAPRMVDLNQESLVFSLSQSLEGEPLSSCVFLYFLKMGHLGAGVFSGKRSKTGGEYDPYTMRRKVIFSVLVLSYHYTFGYPNSHFVSAKTL